MGERRAQQRECWQWSNESDPGRPATSLWGTLVYTLLDARNTKLRLFRLGRDTKKQQFSSAFKVFRGSEGRQRSAEVRLRSLVKWTSFKRVEQQKDGRKVLRLKEIQALSEAHRKPNEFGNEAGELGSGVLNDLPVCGTCVNLWRHRR